MSRIAAGASGARIRVALGCVLGLAFAAPLLAAPPAQGAEVRMMSSGGYGATASELATEFEAQTGMKLIVIRGPSVGDNPDSIPNRLRRGEPADVLVMVDSALEKMIHDGRAVAGTRVDLAESGIGVAVRSGAPLPDISTLDAFQRTMLSAKSIAYSNAVSGVYLSTELFPRLGIWDTIKGKAKQVSAEPVAAVVARGDAEIGMQQMSELKEVQGITIVGALPTGAQKITVYSGAIAQSASNPEGARKLLQFLSTSPAAATATRNNGMDAIPPPAPERTIEEIKKETQARAEKGAYPVIGLSPDDVREALTMIHTRDRDEWAHAFSTVAQRYLDKADKAAGEGKSEEADQAYQRAWRLFYFAQWPVPASSGKKQAYQAAIAAYRKHSQYMDPKLEVIRVPFEDREIVAYLRMPKGAAGRKVPMVLAISGLDSRKETVMENYTSLLSHGVGILSVDGPGTGEAPLRVGPHSERYLQKLVDYLVARPDVDATRIAVHGVSFGGYWATKLAIVEHDRLIGVVAQSPPIDLFFQPHYIRETTLGNREYLFDHAAAFAAVIDGANEVEDLFTLMPPLSLKTEGLLGKPTAPMLVVGGAKDTQVPWVDLTALLSSGDSPKEAWINPAGGHLGRQGTLWPDARIFETVIAPWLVSVLHAN
jgi:ABC-type molybdate transport system substrate-binding protein